MKNRKKQKKTKVLFFLPNCLGGSEHVLITIAKFLNKDFFEVKFVVVAASTKDVKDIIPKNYDILHVFIRNIWDFTTYKLVRLMKKEKPDIVFSSLIYLNARVILSARIVRNIKIIIRNNISYSDAKKDCKLLIKLFYKFSDIIISQQDEMRDELLNVLHLPPHKIITLYNPLDTSLIDDNLKAPSPYNTEENIIKFIWTGRIAPEKGQDALIGAFHIISEKIPNANLYFLGKYSENSSYYQTLIKLIETYNLTKRVHFLGFDKNPHKWIKHADCFIQPSRKEGLPNALIEAMYIGIPVVATRCVPIIDRIIKDGYNGYIVNPDSIDKMAEAMMKAIHLKDFTMTYKSATKEDFQKLFVS
jgi:glycosyltransferase involved in cell wall biosynthesis